mmetsp:Transcript_35630/g.92886  ORF Transcript_35630/g.92886 Transcript_35630/m.92886 type:complete len:226 (-) Transcript_35630:607-1284(-)
MAVFSMARTHSNPLFTRCKHTACCCSASVSLLSSSSPPFSSLPHFRPSSSSLALPFAMSILSRCDWMRAERDEIAGPSWEERVSRDEAKAVRAFSRFDTNCWCDDTLSTTSRYSLACTVFASISSASSPACLRLRRPKSSRYAARLDTGEKEEGGTWPGLDKSSFATARIVGEMRVECISTSPSVLSTYERHCSYGSEQRKRRDTPIVSIELCMLLLTSSPFLSS